MDGAGRYVDRPLQCVPICVPVVMKLKDGVPATDLESLMLESMVLQAKPASCAHAQHLHCVLVRQPEQEFRAPRLQRNDWPGVHGINRFVPAVSRLRFHHSRIGNSITRRVSTARQVAVLWAGPRLELHSL